MPDEINAHHKRPNILDPAFDWLKDRAANTRSQFGEDGLIAALLERYGETNRWCFEVGAADGRFFSNTHTLIAAGWYSVQIEPSPGPFDQLSKLYRDNDRVTCIQAELGPFVSIDSLLATTPCESQPDVGVIDIDGQDYWAMSDLMRYRPRILLAEYFYGHKERFVPLRGGEGQASGRAIVEMGESMGYRAVLATYCNILFLKGELCHSN